MRSKPLTPESDKVVSGKMNDIRVLPLLDENEVDKPNAANIRVLSSTSGGYISEMKDSVD